MRRRLVSVGVGALVFVSLGCGTTRYMRDGGHVGVLQVKSVDWNPQKIDVGRVSDVVESEGSVVVFGDHGATVLTSGALVAVDRSTTAWRMATSIPAADGNGRWIVAVDGDGHIKRLRNGSTFEDVGGRYGLEKDGVVSLADFGEGFVGFDAPGLFAVADGKTITRYEPAAFGMLAGGGGVGAAITNDLVRRFDLKNKADRTFSLEGARRVAVDAHGRLYVATAHEVYEEDARGELSLRYETSSHDDDAGDTIHGLVVSGERVWFADGADLGVLEPNDGVAVTRGLKLANDAKLEPSPSSDVWTINAGTLLRFARADGDTPTTTSPNVAPPTPTAQQLWASSMQPIFAKRCAGCHMPGGSSGVDLSTFDRWVEKKADIRQRVVVARSMPPKSQPPMDDAERAAIADWTR